MQGIICGRDDDETYLLEIALNAAGLTTRTSSSIKPVLENWSEYPADFLLITAHGEPDEALLDIQSLRSMIIAPTILVADPMSEESQIRFYKVGVDMVLARPYSLRLLPYIIMPLLRRSNTIPVRGLPDLVQPSIRLDTRTRSVVIDDGPPIHLTQLEFRLLYTLMVRRGEALSFEEIVSLVWGYHGEDNRELVRGLVQRLRAKIEKLPQNPHFILTESGYGYIFNPTNENE